MKHLPENGGNHSGQGFLDRVRSLLWHHRLCLTAFALPFLAMLAIFICNGIYPFGDGSFMHSDMYHQYVPFMREFLRKLRQGEPLTFSWNIGLGTNFLPLYAYYCASPFNWLAALLPERFLIEFMSYLAIFKIGLMGGCFAWYLKDRFRTESWIILFFSTFYAMSGFVAAYNWDVMWLDCLFLAPLVQRGEERLVQEKRWKLYCVALTLSLLSNYYLSIMVCIFCCLYFLVLLPGLFRKDGWVPALRRIVASALRFAACSLLAGGMAAVLLLPAFCFLRSTKFAGNSLPSKFSFYFAPWKILLRHAVGTEPEVGLDHWPNVFCSSAIFLLLPLYLINRRIPLRERVMRLLLWVFLLLGFSVNGLNFIWHGFNYPNSLPARQSFLYIFLLLSMAFETVYRVRGVGVRHIAVSWALGMGFLLLAGRSARLEAVDAQALAATAALLSLYALLLALYRLGLSSKCLYRVCRYRTCLYRKLPAKTYFPALLVLTLALGLFEATWNMASTSVSTTSRSRYLKNIPASQALSASAEQGGKGFYRFEKFSRVTKNDGALAGYPTASLFSSTSNAALENWYDRMGMSESKVFYCSDGMTPLSSALLSVRWMFSSDGKEHDPALYEKIASQDGLDLYENRYVLPVGFLLKEGQSIEILKGSAGQDNPFRVQNAMINSLGVDAPLFSACDTEESGGDITFLVPQDGHYYAWSANSAIDEVTVVRTEESKTFQNVRYDYILDLGVQKEGDVLQISGKPKDSSGQSRDGANGGEGKEPLRLSVCRLNVDALAQAVSLLGSSPLRVDSWGADFLNGTIDAEEDGTLFFSIAAEGGWELAIDGKPVTPNPYDETFLSAPITAGKHTVELAFHVEGLKAGAWVSLVCAGIFLLACLGQRKNAAPAPSPTSPDCGTAAGSYRRPF